MMGDLETALERYFGFQSFRSGQREVVERAIDGKDTLAVMPTGVGKSLCYQLAAQMLPGMTLVVSPLIALMQDQVDSLRRRKMGGVTFLSSAVDGITLGERYADIERGDYKLVYVAPERCDSPRFQEIIKKSRIDLLVIDEAHCISQWGHDFRPHYRTLLERLPELSRATILAVTATATPAVQDDIVATLGRPKMARVVADFDRPNLHLEVINVHSRDMKERRLVELLSGESGPAIVYCSTRKEAESACELLQGEKISTCLYHGGLDTGRRAESQRLFQQDKRRVIVATVAFGMGIDKPDIRRVIHYNVPGSLESYYQEAGRGGRDGAPATCSLLYLGADLRIQEFLISSSYPERDVFTRVYAMMREASPLPVAAPDIARVAEIPDMAIKSALQLLYDQGLVALTKDGKYTIAHPEIVYPRINFNPFLIRRRQSRERFQKMIDYCTGTACRRRRILNYFGQSFSPPCRACDVCRADERPTRRAGTDAGADRGAALILRTIAQHDGRLGRTLASEILVGSRRRTIVEQGLDRSASYNALRVSGKTRVLEWIDDLIERRLLTVKGSFPHVYITDKGRAALAAASAAGPASTARQQAGDSGTSNAGTSGARPIDETRPTTRNERPTAASSAGQVQQPPESRFSDLRLKIEVWRQAGPAPDPKQILYALEHSEGATSGDLVVFIGAIAELGYRPALSLVQRILKEGSDPSLVAAACRAAGKLGAPAAASDLIRLLDNSSPLVRAGSSHALGCMRVAAALPKLEKLAAGDSTVSVRLAASAACQLIKDLKASPR
jgi:ATP-dependent DNA helicase RecQ